MLKEIIVCPTALGKLIIYLTMLRELIICQISERVHCLSNYSWRVNYFSNLLRVNCLFNLLGELIICLISWVNCLFNLPRELLICLIMQRGLICLNNLRVGYLFNYAERFKDLCSYSERVNYVSDYVESAMSYLQYSYLLFWEKCKKKKISRTADEKTEIRGPQRSFWITKN